MTVTVRPPGAQYKISGRAKTPVVLLLSALISLNFSIYNLPARAGTDAAGDATLAAKAISLQTRIFGKAPPNQLLIDRIIALEIYLMGKPQTGEPEQRLARLQEMLDGKPRPPAPAEAEVAPVNDHLFDVNKPAESPAPSVAMPGAETSGMSKGEIFVPTAAVAGQSFVQSVKQLEERVFGHATAGESAATSLEHLETFALGKAQSGTMEQRLAKLEGLLNGTAPAAVEQSAVGSSGDAHNPKEPPGPNLPGVIRNY